MSGMEAKSPPAQGQLETFSPIDGRRLGALPTITPDQVQSVVDDVAEVQPFWAALPVEDRARYMRRAAEVALRTGKMTLEESRYMLRAYEEGLSGYTYLERD